MAMHDDQLHMSAEVARYLINEQFPEWQDEPISETAADGTVNAIYRIGNRFAARFPLRKGDPGEILGVLRDQATALTELSVCCSFPTPEHVAIGQPGHGYPLAWSVQTWLPGSVATPDGLARSETFADDLATLIQELRDADTRGRSFRGTGRGGELQDHDDWVERCLRESKGLLDVGELRRRWEWFRVLPPSSRDAMSHCDLIPANLLVQGERLVGVLDGGDFSPADVALDLVVAWHLLAPEPRQRLRERLGCGSTEWFRGAAWAFEQAIGLVWYYQATNPGMSALGRSTLRRIVTDPEIVSHG